jgi:hypothetical protein
MDEDKEEQDAPRDVVMVESTPEENILEDQIKTIEPERPVDPPREATVTRKRLAWF